MGKLLVEISVGYPIACSRRSDSGERCEVKRSAKKIKAREGASPPLLFIAIFTSHRSPLSERLEQASYPKKGDDSFTAFEVEEICSSTRSKYHRKK